MAHSNKNLANKNSETKNNPDKVGDLEQLKVAVLVTDGVEEKELTEPVEFLKKHGAQVKLISDHSGYVQAFHHQDKTIQIPIDFTFEDPFAKPEYYDALLLPGGALNADTLRMNPHLCIFPEAPCIFYIILDSMVACEFSIFN